MPIARKSFTSVILMLPWPKRLNPNIRPLYVLVICLTIVVSAFDLKAVQPFNLPIVGQESLTGAVVGGQQLQSYLVDPEGILNFRYWVG